MSCIYIDWDVSTTFTLLKFLDLATFYDVMFHGTADVAC
jgi:hypothetical protein